MEENGAIKEAKEKLDKISEDEKMQQLAWWKEKAIYEENTRQRSAYRKGKEAGVEEGIKEGEKKTKLETAKTMKKDNASVELIIKYTGLTKEEIENL
jgi:predicted transposase/invertase (TIGR01784 family)